MKQPSRNRMLAQLADLDPGTVQQHSRAVAQRLTGLPEYASAKSLAVYVSFGAEIQTHDLIRHMLVAGRQICVPAFQGGTYRTAVIRDFDQDLQAGQLGILEPSFPRHELATPPDVWLVPGLAFDRAGNRLGRGKGYFDALLQHASGVKIALAHDFQLLTEVPSELHDVRMDFIITEHQIIECTRNHESKRD